MLNFSDALTGTSGFSFPIGETAAGDLLTTSFEHTPHLLIAGATGTGKSVLAHSIILSLLSHNDSKTLKMILCDTKLVEFCEYSGVSNLLIPVCTDVAKITGALEWSAFETKRRLNLLSSVNSKTLSSYNYYAWESFLDDLPHILVVVDDLASVVSAYPAAISAVQEILQNGRTVGVHLIAITQTPTLKPTKQLALMFRNKALFSFSSKAESSLLVGTSKDFGLGSCGYCLFSDGGALQKVKTIQPPEKLALEVISTRKIQPPHYSESVLRELDKDVSGYCENSNPEEDDDLFPVAVDIVLTAGYASVSMVQRRLKLGYKRAASLVDKMEDKGIISPLEGSRPRMPLITKSQWEQMTRLKGKLKVPEIGENPEQPPNSQNNNEGENLEVIEAEENTEQTSDIQYNSEDDNDAQKTAKCSEHKRKRGFFGILFKQKRLE